MIESQQVLEWMAQGEAKGKVEGMLQGEVCGEANALLRLLAKRFPPGPPSDLVAAIQAATDLQRLRNWFDLAYAADSLDAFRQAATV